LVDSERREFDEGLAAYWPTVTDETGFAERTDRIPKYVASGWPRPSGAAATVRSAAARSGCSCSQQRRSTSGVALL
jgi:hypothetical protein